MTVFLYVLVAIVSLLLIGIILIQPAKSGGMGSAFGGIGESVFGAQVGSHLTKATVIMTAVFFITTLLLASFIGHGWHKHGTVSGVTKALEQSDAAEIAVPGESAALSSPAETPSEIAE